MTWRLGPCDNILHILPSNSTARPADAIRFVEMSMKAIMGAYSVSLSVTLVRFTPKDLLRSYFDKIV